MRNPAIVLSHVAFSLVLTLGGLASARTWSTADGKFTVDADMLGVADGKVQLRRADDGRVIDVPLDKLSDADRKYVADQSHGSGAKPSQDKPATIVKPVRTGPVRPALPVAPRPTEEKIRLGAFSMEDDVKATVYARIVPLHGGSLKPGAAEAIQSGEVTAVNNDDGTRTKWEVYVPNDYTGELPFGIFAFINSDDSGGIPGDWRKVLDKHHLIWVEADKSGNKIDTALRHALAVEGVRNIRSRYRADALRIYVSGISGGGRVASHVMLMDADLFAGGFPMCGCNPYRNLENKGGGYMAGSLKGIDQAAFLRAQRNNRFVFFSGETDFNRQDTEGIFEQYQADGFRNVVHLVQPGLGHGTPNAEWFEKGIVALDAPAAFAAGPLQKQAALLEKRGSPAVAQQIYLSLVAHAEGTAQEDAKKRVAAIDEQYEQEVAKLETVFASGDVAQAKKGLERFRTRWGERADRDYQRFADALPKPKKRTPR